MILSAVSLAGPALGVAVLGVMAAVPLLLDLPSQGPHPSVQRD